MLMPLYLWHSEGLTMRNMEILHAVGEAIASFGGPWVLAGDFNMEPETLKARGFLAVTNGHLCAHSQPTCNERCFDYFIVSKCMAPFVHSVTTLEYDGIKPRAPVRLLLRGDARRLAVKKLVRPGKVVAVRQHGPTQNPELLLPLLDDDSTHADAEAALQAWNNSRRRVGTAWRQQTH